MPPNSPAMTDDVPLPPDPRERNSGQAGELTPAIPAADWVSQASTIEVSRAVAEVEAAVIVAQKLPRNLVNAEREMIRSCQHPRLAERAFYRFPRGKKPNGQTNFVEGPTVALMREVMRCFGNCQAGVAELRRHKGWSEMTAFAWDLQQNVRESTTFIVTHARDKSDGSLVELDSERDKYELNANMGARRERAMIERILPVWFVEIAIDTARKTLAGDPKDFLPRVDKAVKTFSAWGIKQEHLEAKLGGVPRDNWRDVDLATLLVLWQSLQRQETTVDEEFPDLRTGKSAKSVLEEAAAARPPDSSAASPAATTTGGPGTAPSLLVTSRRRTTGTRRSPSWTRCSPRRRSPTTRPGAQCSGCWSGPTRRIRRCPCLPRRT